MMTLMMLLLSPMKLMTPLLMRVSDMMMMMIITPPIRPLNSGKC